MGWKNKQSAGWNVAMLLAMLLATTLTLRAQQPGATLSGVVRDRQGAPQAGALVQLLERGRGNPFDSVRSAAAVFTDGRGRYAFARVTPGEYEVRATAATFLPTLREHLRLAAGARLVADMTLSTLFEAGDWLPAERRRADEAGDDWKWTLRSTVNRPLLRLAGDEGEVEASKTRGRVAVIAGGGGFAEGGVRGRFTVDRALAGGNGMVLRAELGGARAGGAATTASKVSAGYERRGGFYGNRMRMVAQCGAQPELARGAGQAGLRSVRLLSAERVQLSDALGIDAGAAMTAVRMGTDAAEAQPFVKVVARPGERLLVSYDVATARGFESIEDMDGAAAMGVPEFALVRGRLRMESGLHQELAVSRSGERGSVQAAWYHDSLHNPVVNGVGAVDAAALASGNYVADAATGSFRVAGADYAGSGVNLSASERLGEAVWAVVDISTGKVLAVRNAAMGVENAESAALMLRGTVARTGTRWRAGYRWQPQGTVTAVNPYDETGAAYLSVEVRQPMHLRGLPQRGIEATLEAGNLLAQGYAPVATDGEGRAIYYAQTERTLEAGLEFTF